MAAVDDPPAVRVFALRRRPNRVRGERHQGGAQDPETSLFQNPVRPRGGRRAGRRRRLPVPMVSRSPARSRARGPAGPPDPARAAAPRRGAQRAAPGRSARGRRPTPPGPGRTGWGRRPPGPRTRSSSCPGQAWAAAGGGSGAHQGRRRLRHRRQSGRPFRRPRPRRNRPWGAGSENRYAPPRRPCSPWRARRAATRRASLSHRWTGRRARRPPALAPASDAARATSQASTGPGGVGRRLRPDGGLTGGRSATNRRAEPRGHAPHVRAQNLLRGSAVRPLGGGRVTAVGGAGTRERRRKVPAEGLDASTIVAVHERAPEGSLTARGAIQIRQDPTPGDQLEDHLGGARREAEVRPRGRPPAPPWPPHSTGPRRRVRAPGAPASPG